MPSTDPFLPAAAAAKPGRADARRNRVRLLEAAEAIFAAEGASATTEAIARRAGVGIGTLFRNFPTKDALIEAVVAARVQRLIEEADNLIANGDPATAFYTFFRRVVEEMAAKKLFTDLMVGGGMEVNIADLRLRMRGAVGILLSRAQEHGIVRADVRVPEVMALVAGASRAIEHAGGDQSLRDHIVRIILDGFRPAAS